jgi:hypothetical protein
MKKTILFLVFVTFGSGLVFGQSQSNSDVKETYNLGVRQFKKKNYNDAEKDLNYVIEAVPRSETNADLVFIKLDSYRILIKMYFDILNQLRFGCEALDAFCVEFENTKNKNVLSIKDSEDFSKFKEECVEYEETCNKYKSVDKDRKNFENVFNDSE